MKKYIQFSVKMLLIIISPVLGTRLSHSSSSTNHEIRKTQTATESLQSSITSLIKQQRVSSCPEVYFTNISSNSDFNLDQNHRPRLKRTSIEFNYTIVSTTTTKKEEDILSAPMDLSYSLAFDAASVLMYKEHLERNTYFFRKLVLPQGEREISDELAISLLSWCQEKNNDEFSNSHPSSNPSHYNSFDYNNQIMRMLMIDPAPSDRVKYNNVEYDYTDPPLDLSGDITSTFPDDLGIIQSSCAMNVLDKSITCKRETEMKAYMTLVYSGQAILLPDEEQNEEEEIKHIFLKTLYDENSKSIEFKPVQWFEDEPDHYVSDTHIQKKISITSEAAIQILFPSIEEEEEMQEEGSVDDSIPINENQNATVSMIESGITETVNQHVFFKVSTLSLLVSAGFILFFTTIAYLKKTGRLFIPSQNNLLSRISKTRETNKNWRNGLSNQAYQDDRYTMDKISDELFPIPNPFNSDDIENQNTIYEFTFHNDNYINNGIGSSTHDIPNWFVRAVNDIDGAYAGSDNISSSENNNRRGNSEDRFSEADISLNTYDTTNSFTEYFHNDNYEI